MQRMIKQLHQIRVPYSGSRIETLKGRIRMLLGSSNPQRFASDRALRAEDSLLSFVWAVFRYARRSALVIIRVACPKLLAILRVNLLI